MRLMQALQNLFTPKSQRIRRQVASDAKLAQSLAVPNLDRFVIAPKGQSFWQWMPTLRAKAFVVAQGHTAQGAAKLPADKAFRTLGRAMKGGFRGHMRFMPDGGVQLTPFAAPQKRTQK